MRSSSPGEPNRLRGTLSKIRFASDDGRFAVCELQVPQRVLPVTMVGDILAAREGTIVEVTGQWRDDPRYGRQFQIATIEVELPATSEGIEKYLASSMIEGIGPTLAKRIVDHFGEATLEILDDAPERIIEVEGIGEKRATRIIESWRRDRTVHRLLVALRSHGISAKMALKIHERFGGEALSLIQRDPYRLVEEIRGIGFFTCDKIARHFGIDDDSPARLRAGLLHALGQAQDDGHVYLPRPLLQEQARELLGTEIGDLDDALDELELREQVIVEPRTDAPEAIYPVAAHRAEVGAAAHLRRLAGQAELLPRITDDLHQGLSKIEGDLGFELATAQRKAVISVFARPLSVITGGPGTGKTTIVDAICRMAQKRGQSVALAAPTGRAARRLGEATGLEARTIHRLLEFSFDKGGFQFDEERPLTMDLLIIDEASMIDIYLLYALVRAIPTGAHLVLVGDVDQLPSVGPGQILRDLIAAPLAGVARLTEIFRQAEASSIVVNAHRINAGKIPLAPRRDDGELVDFYTIHADDPDTARRLIIDLATERVPNAFGFDAHRDVQILSPMYRGDVGCQRLNADLQQIFCGDQVSLTRGDRVIRQGDRVMQTRNDYEREVFNGDIGRVVDIDTDAQELTVDFDDRPVTYPREGLDQLSLAYAITVHKSQGSEYPVVIVPVTTQHYMMLQRNLLYTAVTRGRDLVILVGTRRAVEIAVTNAGAHQRYTGLARRLND